MYFSREYWGNTDGVSNAMSGKTLSAPKLLSHQIQSTHLVDWSPSLPLPPRRVVQARLLAGCGATPISCMEADFAQETPKRQARSNPLKSECRTEVDPPSPRKVLPLGLAMCVCVCVTDQSLAETISRKRMVQHDFADRCSHDLACSNWQLHPLAALWCSNMAANPFLQKEKNEKKRSSCHIRCMSFALMSIEPLAVPLDRWSCRTASSPT